MQSSRLEAMLPQLPGFRSNRPNHRDPGRKQQFKFKEGEFFLVRTAAEDAAMTQLATSQSATSLTMPSDIERKPPRKKAVLPQCDVFGAPIVAPAKRENNNEMKRFAEALLGKTVDNSGRGGFLKYDRTVLRFFAEWDDRGSIYGDLTRFRLHYFLVDDTIEVLTEEVPNAGRDSYPLLVKRGKLPYKGRNYHWRDLLVGGSIEVYSRKMVLCDCDPATRAFYAENGINMEKQEEAVLPVVTPQVALKKIDSGSIRFQARFVDAPGPVDKDRVFVVAYDFSDGAISVREPPIRNSGVAGGQFLAKQRFARPEEASEYMGPSDLHVGAIVELASHRFLLFETDESSLKMMEARPEDFPFSDPPLLIHFLKDQARQQSQEDLKARLGESLVTLEDLGAFVAGLFADDQGAGLPAQAHTTLFRALRSDAEATTIHAETLINLLFSSGASP